MRKPVGLRRSARDVIAVALLDFNWAEYSLHEVETVIANDVTDWADDLAREILRVMVAELAMPAFQGGERG